MKKIYIVITIMATALLASCMKPEAESPAATEMDVVKALIENCETRTYLADDGVTTYWSAGDRIGIYTAEGSSNLEFVTSTASEAYNGIFKGPLSAQTPAYAYYPYVDQPGDYTAVELNLATEQDAESISDYDFKACVRTSRAVESNFELNFRGVLSMLAVTVDASGTPLTDCALKSVTVQALPSAEGEEAPAMTGDFKMNLAEVTTSFEGTTYDYAKLVWTTPHKLSEGKATAQMFINPDAVKVGTPLMVTFETEDGTSATATFASAKDCTANTMYSFDMNLSALSEKVVYSGNPLASVSFLQDSNTRLLKSSLYTGNGLSNGQDYVNSETRYDISCTYDESEGVWTAVIPYLYDFSDLVASFETVEEDATVYLNGVEQESGVTMNDFNEVVTYEVVDASGARTSAKVKVVNSGLPVVTITGTVYSKATDFDNIEGTTTINIDGTDYTCGLRLRGNSTQNMPKKPYAFKLDSKASILGMPKHKRWVLLANWLDRTMLRNDLAFHLAHQTDTWAPHGQNVEVVLNGVHVGNYWLGEQIKIDENRLNIASVDAADYATADEAAANVGFLLECDAAADDSEIWFRIYSPVPFYVYIKDPGDAESGTAANTYIQDYYSSVGSALSSRNWSTAESLIDYKSFADHWIFTELTENQESKHPKSFYMYKDAGGKLCAGPAWDYDWGTFIPMENIGSETSGAGTVKNYWTAKYTMWYTYLFNDTAFVAMVKERWAAMKSGFESALPYLDQQAELMRVSDTFNHEMWPCTGFNKVLPNYDESLTYDEAIAQMRSSLEARIEWLDGHITSM